MFLGAQGYTYSGTRFYLPSNEPFEQKRDSTLINVFSEVNNCVDLRIPNTGLSYRLKIQAGQSKTVRLDTCFINYRDNFHLLPDSLNKGYLISSVYPVAIELHSYTLNESFGQSNTTKAYYLPPANRLGQEYLFFGSSVNLLSQFGADNYFVYVLFTENEIDYKVKVLQETRQFKPDTLYTVYHNGYDLLVDVNTGGSAAKLDGSMVESINGEAFGFFYCGTSVARHNCLDGYATPIQWYFKNADVCGFMPDVEKAGVRYAVTSIQYGNAPRMRCMSMEDSNRVYVNGVQVAQLNQGEVWDTCGYDEAIVESDKPMLLGYNTSNMYRVDSTYSHRPTGAMSYYVPHTGQMINYTRFKAESFRYADSFFVNLQCRTADTALFVHNGAPWKNLGFKPFTHDSTYSYARVNITAAEHSIKNPNGFIGVHYSMTLSLPFKPGRQDPETRFEGYIYPLGGIAPEDTAIRPYTYSIDGVNFRAFTKDSPVKLCEGKPLYLLASSVSNTQIRWDFGNGDTLVQQVEDEDIDTIVVNFANAGNYSITTSVLNWPCVKGDTLFVQVQDPGILDFEYQVHQGCDGNILTAWATSSSYTDYRWLLEGKQVGDGGQLEYALKASDSELELVLIAASEFCNDTVLQEILLSDPQQGLVVPNVFTPNGDGVNECFLIEGVAGYESCYELSIFNRWGKKVFTSSDPKQCWDGGTVNPGVYYYVLDIGKEEYKGNLFLNR